MARDYYEFDLIIVGAGIHGASVAHEAVLTGLRVLLIEQYDRPARGTSSKSSKLIHGGLRYLESLELNLVYECLSDRRRLLEKYPDLVRLQKFYIPVYRDTSRSRLIIRTGLGLYALLGGMRRENRFHSLAKEQWQELDGLRTDDLLAVFQYYDAQTDDALLTERLIQEADKSGAEILFNAEFLQCNAGGDAVTVKFKYGNEYLTRNARYLINAAGPWVNEVVAGCKPAFKELEIDLVQGTHIEVPGQLLKGIYYLEAPQDRRAVFAMPWKGHIMVGTTEALHTGPASGPAPTEKETEYLLSIYNHYFSQVRNKITPDEIIDSWSGLRVLPKSDSNPFKRTRETIFLPDNKNNPKIYSIYGGKLTSHYSTAIKLLKLLNI